MLLVLLLMSFFEMKASNIKQMFWWSSGVVNYDFKYYIIGIRVGFSQAMLLPFFY